MTRIAFTILGEPASKANSRVLSTIGPKDNRRTILRKGNKALGYEHDALRQIPPAARQRLEGPVRLTVTIFYASRRPDLEGDLVKDVLQDRWARDKTTKARVLVQAGVYRNDRQIEEEHWYRRLDPKNPRAEVIVEPLQAQQPELGLAPKPADPFADWPTDERTAA